MLAEVTVGLAVRVCGLFDYRDRRLLDVPLQRLERPAQLAGDVEILRHATIREWGLGIAYATVSTACNLWP